MPKPRTRLARFVRNWVVPFATVAAVMLPLRSAVADWCDVPTGSMEPTILPGDRILVNKLAYGLRVPFTYKWLGRWDDPSRGEIVILFSPKDDMRLVKRLVGVPGDTVELRNERLYINGVASEYTPLSQDVSDAIAPARRSGLEFARESLGGRTHAVMLSPSRPAMRSFGPVTLGPDEFWVMGDNRDNSADSRYFGAVKRERIVGRSSRIALSVDPDRHYLPRWGRFGAGMK